jgi:hypothetical protein
VGESLGRAKERGLRGIKGFALGDKEKGILPGGNIFTNPKATLALLGAAGEVAAAPIAGVMGLAEPEIEKGVGFVAEKIPESVKQKASELIDLLPEETKQSAGDAFASLGLLAAGPQKKIAKKLLGKVAQKTVPKITKRAATKTLPKIEQAIQPKLTAKQQRIARIQGRVTRPKTSKLKETIFGKKQDIVEPTKRSKQAAQTVQREVPKAAEMDDIALEKAVRAKSLEKVAPLKEKLKTVQLDRKAVPKLKKEWAIQKTKNTENLRSVGVKENTINRNFEKTMMKMTQQVRDAKTGKLRSKNMDDIWDLTKSYDDTISEPVKNATGISSDALQVQKQTWLTNRRILRNFIKANSKEAKEAFGIMHDLLTAADDMATLGLETKKMPSPLKESLKKWAIRGGASYVGYKALFN